MKLTEDEAKVMLRALADGKKLRRRYIGHQKDVNRSWFDMGTREALGYIRDLMGGGDYEYEYELEIKPDEPKPQVMYGRRHEDGNFYCWTLSSMMTDTHCITITGDTAKIEPL